MARFRGGDDRAAPVDLTATTVTDRPAPPRPPRKPPPSIDDFSLPRRFEPLRVLGQGAMGTVLAVHDRTLDRDVAVKVMDDQALADERYRVRFLREARAAATLRHPNIVTVHDVDASGEYIVLELVHGESLKERIQRFERLPPREVRRLGASLLAALAAAHRAGIVHRDVKPANILLDEHDNVKLADFGVASFGDSELTSTGTRIGTPAYMAPEQLRGRDVGPAADVYAAGATLFEAATGHKLHQQDGRVRDPAALVFEATADGALAQAIARAVEERVSDRFEDADAFSAALARRRTTIPGATLPRAGHRRWSVAAAVALVVAGAGIAAMLGQPSGAEERALLAASTAARPAAVAVAVLPFIDRTGDVRLDFARSGLAHLLGTELRRSDELRVIGYYELRDRLAGVDASVASWRDVAGELGATFVVRGQLAAARRGVRVIITVESIGGVTVHRSQWDAEIGDVPRTVRSAGVELARTVLGADLTAQGDDSRSFAVERELQLGIAALERRDFAAAETHLESAAAHDAALAEAHYHLAVLRWWQTRPDDQILASIDRALDGSLSEPERRFAEGLRLLVTLDYPRAVEFFRQLAARYPNDRNIQYGLFEATFHGGHPADAMAAYRRLRELSPRFRLGHQHALDYALARADAAAIDALLAGADPDAPEAIVWRARADVATRAHAGAIARLERALETGGSGAEGAIRAELIGLYAVTGQLALALELAHRLAEQDPAQHALGLAALQRVRGDGDQERHWLRRALLAAELGIPGPTARDPWLTLLALVAPTQDAAQVRELGAGLEQAWGGPVGDMVDVDVARALVAGITGERAGVDSAARSHFPEVAAVAEAFTARRRRAPRDAAAAWRRAAAASGTGRFRLVELYLAASALRDAADHAAVVALCDELIEPRRFDWSWASVAPACLRWSAEAAAALGRPADARTRWRRLLVLRAAAPPDDALVAAARAALAAD